MILLSPDSHVALDDLTGTFAGLMDLYERNYIGIRCLVPDMPPPRAERTSRVAGGLPLYLQVREQHKYTTELSLTYRFDRGGSCKIEPNLRIRIYHDARLAEVTNAELRHWPSFDAHRDTAIGIRWRVNRFLSKWLKYCQHQGHRFSAS